MNPLLPVLMQKLAAEETFRDRAERKLRRMAKKTKRKVLELGSGRISRRELRTIKKQIRQQKPKTEEEKRIEQLAGPAWTKGRYVRGALIGAGMGMATHPVSAAIQRQKIRDPRAVLAAGAVGAMFGSALPAAKRLADIEAAKAGVY